MFPWGQVADSANAMDEAELVDKTLVKAWARRVASLAYILPARRRAFQGKCVGCHGPAGKGDRPIGKKLKPPTPDFTSAASKAKSQDELRSIVENGIPKTAMKAYKKQLTEAELQDVLALRE